jgi:hypothetical protein
VSKLDADFFSDEKRVTISREVAREGPLFVTVFTIERVPEVPPEIGLMVGDVIGSYRASLDHLAWELVERVGEMPNSSGERIQIQFPLANSASSFKHNLNRRLPGVPNEYCKILKPFQPYRRGYDGQAMKLLRRLSNTDKHRVIVPTATASAETNFIFDARSATIIEHEYGIGFGVARKLKPGSMVAIVTALDDAGSTGEVTMEGYIQPYPSLGRHIDVQAALTYIGELITRLLTEMEELF